MSQGLNTADLLREYDELLEAILTKRVRTECRFSPQLVSTWKLRKPIPAKRKDDLIRRGSKAIVDKDRPLYQERVERLFEVASKLRPHKSLRELRERVSSSGDWTEIRIHPSDLDLLLGERHSISHYGRLKYLGTDGGLAWKEFYESLVMRRAATSRVAGEVVKLIHELQPRPGTFVSLGPGEGTLDGYIMSALRPVPEYVPIDISTYLLGLSIKNLRARVAVVCDFEEHFADLVRFIDRRCEAPYVFSCLGNTFGNLDGHQQDWIKKVKQALEDSSKQWSMCLHVSVYDSTYTVDNDIYLQTERPQALEKFLAQAVKRVHTDLDEEGAVDYVRRNVTSEKAKDCCVDGSLGILFKDRNRAGKPPVLSVWRFNYESLVKWLESSGFSVRGSCFFDHAMLGHAVLMLGGLLVDPT